VDPIRRAFVDAAAIGVERICDGIDVCVRRERLVVSRVDRVDINIYRISRIYRIDCVNRIGCVV
jgi:hypothetical protein